MDLDKLQKIIDDEEWKNDPQLLEWIYGEFTRLMAEEQDRTGRQNFNCGSVNFFNAILGEDQEGNVFCSLSSTINSAFI